MSASAKAKTLDFIDSHTEGEPTRVIVGGLPDPAVDPSLREPGSIRARAAALLTQHPSLRAAIVDEPRGYPALVAALLLPPSSSRADAAVIYLNNVGTLPMCVHASIGLAPTLVRLGRAPAGPWPRAQVLETFAGEVEICVEADGRVAVTNVPAYRMRADVELATSHGLVRGDLAWGGNWFLIVEASPVPVDGAHLSELHALTRELRAGLERAGLRGDDGGPIDHIQLCGPSDIADARNFVLCPGGEHDRSPCGTGTSARMACLHAQGRLAPGQAFRQEGITGTCFDGEIAVVDASRVRPTIRGRAWLTAEGRLLFDPADPHGPQPFTSTSTTLP